MFERHFGLRENPFHSGHQMRFLYPSREHQEARAHLRYGIENREPFVLITGEVGTGKTTALYDALAEWGNKVAVALITNSALSREELIEEIGLRFGLSVPAGTSKPQALAQLERHLLGVRARGEHAVLLLDEAQNLAPELLEEIRLLSNLETQGEKLVQIFLVGQPELEAKLADAQLRQLRQRITVHYRLNPLSPEETAGYIHHRIAVAGGNPFATFPPESCREVYRLTHGIPREINTVAAQALIAAFSENAHTVRPEHVRAIAQEYEFRSVMGGPAAHVPEPVAPSAPTPEPSAPNASAPAPAGVAGPGANLPPPAIETPSAEGETLTWHEPEWLQPSAPEARTEAPAESTLPAWAPPDLESPAPAAPAAEPVETVRREELDAWTRAAHDLIEARRRSPANEPAAAPHDGDEGDGDERDDDVPAEPASFPTLAELHARGETAQPHNADLSGLPERLRRKIADDIARDERPRNTLPLVLAGVAVVALAVGLVLMQRFQVIDIPVLRGLAGGASASDTTRHADMPAAPAHSAAPVSSVADSTVIATRDTTTAARDSAKAAGGVNHVAGVPVSMPVATRPVTALTPSANAKPAPVAPPAIAKGAATRPAAATAKPIAASPATPKPAAAVAAQVPATTTKPAPGPATAPRTDGPVFGVGIAHYLDQDRANLERDRYAGETKLPAIVVPYKDGGATLYRVVLGKYPTNAAAERAATNLMAHYGVPEAQVFKLPAKAKPR